MNNRHSIFRRRTTQPKRLRRLAPVERTPITVDVDFIDITVQPVDPTSLRAQVVRPNLQDVTVEPLAITTEITADTVVDLGIIDINVTPLRLESVVRFIDVTVVPQDVDVAKIIDLDLIDITVTPQPVISFRSYRVDAIDVTVTPQAIELDKIVDVVSFNVDVTPLDIDPVKIIDLGIIDITVTPQAVISFRSYRVDTIDISQQVLNVEVEKVFDVPFAWTFNVLPQAIDPAKIVDLGSPIDITIESRPISVQFFDDTPVLITVQLPPLDIGKSTESFSFIQDLQVAPFVEPARFIAQDIRTGEFLHWELPISNPSIDYNLSGAVVISGSFDNEVRDLEDVGLEPLATWIHVEENETIRASGILQPTNSDGGQALTLEAVGPSAYPAGLPYQGSFTQIAIDPADVIRHLWAHIQGFPDGNLGVAVTGTTATRVGKPLPPVIPSGVTDPNPNDNDDKPYSLQWWEAPDVGDEINKLLQDAKVDYVERSQWNSDKTDVLHFIDIKSPRAGGQRDDLTFVQEENLIGAVAPKEIEGFFASTVILFGKGEGSTIIRGYASAPNPRRIRRVVVLTDPMVDNKERADAICRAELQRRQAIFEIEEVLADARHPNARLGDFELGDDVLVKANLPKLGEINQYQRIIGYTYYPDTEQLRVRMRRSDSFVYGTGALV